MFVADGLLAALLKRCIRRTAGFDAHDILCIELFDGVEVLVFAAEFDELGADLFG